MDDDIPWNRDGDLNGSERWRYEKDNARSYKIPLSASSNSDGKSGVLYNWYAAVGGINTYDGFGYGYSVVGSICPKGWRLPVDGDIDTDKSYAKLSRVYFGSQTDEDGLIYYSETLSVWQSVPLSFGKIGTDHEKMNGNAVRCVAR